MHLDIKPENILFNQGNYLLSDFGYSINFTDNLSLEKLQEGDGRYTAGEVLFEYNLQILKEKKI